MKVLVVGGGGREHAIAWKCAQVESVSEVLVAPGNAGTAAETKVRNVAVGAEDIDALVSLAIDEAVDLTIIGPEAPLVAGVVDAFQSQGLRCFGPTQRAAQLEASKIFCKEFLTRHTIPTAEFRTFTDIDAAEQYLRERGAPIVVKADGLAAGKGVTVAGSVAEALEVVRGMLSGELFGDAGKRVLIEDCLTGEEASFIAMVDGKHVLALASSQDHKARDEGDTGPNTGGMGAYSPAPVVDASLHEQVMNRVMLPTVRGMADEGAPFVGFLYAGLMIAADGTPNVLEFNCRLGDPETQPLLMRLQSDLTKLCGLSLDGRLDAIEPEWDTRTALGVVMAAGGYPGSYRKGDVIRGLDDHQTDTKVFHAGTTHAGDDVVTAGGRVLCVCALGSSVEAAQQAAYRRVDSVTWDGAYCRRDIGYRAIGRG